jgi:UDP-N-acetylmuramoyl-tripeptide--D-alanyl-D-alanine ligase
LTVKPIYFGYKNPENNVRADKVCIGENVTFTARWSEGFMNVAIPVEGEHYVSDAMAAVSAGLVMGVAPEAIVMALENFRNMEGRQEIFEAKNCTIIKDCYNAGPESMAAALAVLGNRPGRRIAVLGDMLELGVCAPAEHYKVGRIAAENADALLAYGPNSTRMISGALTGGMNEGMTGAYTDRDALVAALKRLIKPGDVLLFKGSHGMHMEIALEKFLKDET